MTTLRSIVPIAAIMLAALGVRPAQAQDRDRLHQRAEELVQIIEGLEQGLHALERLGDRAAMQHLAEIAERVRRERHDVLQRLERGDRPDAPRRPDADHIHRAMELFQLALSAFRETGRGDAAELVERGLRAMELVANGREEEARAAHEGLPGRDDFIELMRRAERIHRELGHVDRADRMHELLTVLAAETAEASEPTPAPDEAPAEMMRQLEIAHVALDGLRESGNERAARRMNRWLEARRAQMERGIAPPDDAIPSLDDRAELLQAGANAWDRLGHERKAAAVREMAGQYAEAARAERADPAERAEDAERDAPVRRDVPEDARARRLESMETQVREMRQALERMQQQLRRLRGVGDQ